MNWRRVAAHAGRRPYTLLNDVLPASRAETSARQTRHPDDLAKLIAEDPDAAREAVFTELLDHVAPLVGMSPTVRSELRATFPSALLSELGLDSLTTVQLRNRLLAEYSVEIAPHHLFGGTGTEVVDLICQQLSLRNIVVIDDLDPGEVDGDVLTL